MNWKNKNYNSWYSKKNRKTFRVYHKEYISRVKKAVFGFYCGGKIRCMCEGCPIRHIDLLSIDHIVPIRGKRYGAGQKYGWNLWLWIKKMGYPKGFQVLCMACNKAKGTNRCCPRYGKKH
ncbi:Uncharacterised protein [uncultured archaeon]|nr:Uncharacterised protein [uncultured archaeon]